MNEDEATIISLVENLQRDDLTSNETIEDLQKSMKFMSARELAKKIDKDHAYVVSIAGTGELLTTLNKHDIQVSRYPSEEDREEGQYFKNIACSCVVHKSEGLYRAI